MHTLRARTILLRIFAGIGVDFLSKPRLVPEGPTRPTNVRLLAVARRDGLRKNASSREEYSKNLKPETLLCDKQTTKWKLTLSRE